ncbi:MAG TPA: TAT-variant-translocated molybdopterin oxidoreductase [Edaphocola sp.]|nr:TAT-variant-translocated molybdopterin oxidoreductase [Edaphocola sp.]
MSQKKYWKGLEELANTPEYQKSLKDEFTEDLPFDMTGKLLDAKTPRRDFLKFLGFSTLAATAAASCEMPVRKAIPYAIKPENITPGMHYFYASTFVDNGEAVPVLVKTVEGRPIMIQGNKSSKITNGGSSARLAAATLGLYDKTRLRQPHVDGKPVDTFDKIDNPVMAALQANAGTTVLLTSTIVSPTVQMVIDQFVAKYPGAKHVTYDPISYSGMILANEASYGSRMIPNFRFDQAKTIVSIGADFLGSWLSPIEFSHGYTQSRKILSKDAATVQQMSKHYQIESMFSLTGTNADERATCKPSEYGKVVEGLYNAVTSGAAANTGSKNLDNLIKKAAADLKKGNGLVVCGSNDVNVQIVVNAINAAIGANGTTVDFTNVAKYKKGVDADMVDLVAAMNAGTVSTLLMYGVNPAYEYYESEKFISGLKKVKNTVSFADRLDETAKLCKYVISDHHWLESWGDAEPKANHISFIQPTIAPLFKTRAFAESLLKWTGATQTYHDFFNAYWVGKLTQSTFDKALQDGVIEPETLTVSGASFAGNVQDAISKAKAIKGGEYEVVVYPSVAIGHGGSWSNNPWLQELPDPVTKVTWDNYIMMAPKTAKEKFDAELTSLNQVNPKKRVLKVTVNGHSVELPVVVTPGIHNNVIAIAVGYGRDKGVGLAAADLGKNAYPLMNYNGQTFTYDNAVKIEKTENHYPVGITQTHNSTENRPFIYEYSKEEFLKNPYELIEERKHTLEHYLIPATADHTEHHDLDAMYGKGKDFDAKKFEDDFAKNGTHYPVYEKQGLHWAMSIDLNACTGCGACVIACHSENNVSVVGKERVIKAQEMSWLTIDRYFAGDPNDPDSVQAIYQPVMCQHCDNAPCENVCPVSATNHSSEGLNQMAYNRCIGTKYCANNCPFKVRRFNWMDWNGADCFADNLYTDGRRDDINDDLTRMVLNPEVTVRSRGVMEKCSFCVQRLQAGKLDAKKEGVPLKDHHISTACQSACPTEAITFGNLNDKESAVYMERYLNNKERMFYMLESLHILPNVSYMAKIRNTDEKIEMNSGEDEIYKQHL